MEKILQAKKNALKMQFENTKQVIILLKSRREEIDAEIEINTNSLNELRGGYKIIEELLQAEEDGKPEK